MMTSFKVTISALLLLTLAQPLVAQFDPYSGSPPINNDPRARRAMRERAVAYAGEASRDFIESLGDPAVAAIFACSQDGARKLVEFYNSGKLAKLPRPTDLLRVVAMPGHGNDVVVFAMQHEAELTDVDHFDAYLLSPLEYAYGLRKLSEGAAEARARRLSGQAAPWQYTLDGRSVAIGVGILGLLLLLWWRSRRGG
jgi:hypothetical protein